MYSICPEPVDALRFAPIGWDMPYGVIAGNNPINANDPYGFNPYEAIAEEVLAACEANGACAGAVEAIGATINSVADKAMADVNWVLANPQKVSETLEAATV